MSHPVGVHWIPAHHGQIDGRKDSEWLALWNPAWVKIVWVDENVPYLEDIPSTARIIYRNHPLSELWTKRGFTGGTPRQEAERAVQSCVRSAEYCEARGVPRARLWFEGLNEPEMWAGEKPEMVAEYYANFLDGLHKHDLRGVVGNFGVGWPGNGGKADAPVQWDFFKPVIDRMILTGRMDYLGLHEYWALNGVTNEMNGQGNMWRWWAGRYEQCPYKVPILITETGIDTGVTGQFGGGWANLPGTTDDKARRFVGELAWYWNRCRADGRIEAIFPFTFDRGHDTWVHFDMRGGVMLNEIISRRGEFMEPKPFEVAQPDVLLPGLLARELGAKYIDARSKIMRHATKKYDTRQLSAIKRIIVHHDAGAPIKHGETLTRAQVIARYHVTSPDRNYPGPGYHFLIGPDGTVVQMNSLEQVSWHTANNNADSIGICFAGNFMKEKPTTAALLSFTDLCSALEAYLKVKLDMFGHRDINKTTVCPGDNLYQILFGNGDPLPEDEKDFNDAKKLWWIEEAIRSIESKDSVRARDILISWASAAKRE